MTEEVKSSRRQMQKNETHFEFQCGTRRETAHELMHYRESMHQEL